MKKFPICLLVICLLFCLLPVSAADAELDASVSLGCNTIEGQVPFLGTRKLVENGQAMILYEVNTDTLMYADNADTQLPPASLLKILTALIALEKGTLNDVVTVRREVLQTIAPDAAVVGIVPDEVLTVEDLLYCMMVGSGNDAAAVLADHIMGSQSAFVTEMNKYAEKVGCTNTHFTNVHGLHDKNQYTSARDVAKILVRALQNEKFCQIFGARTYTVPQTNKSDRRVLVTQNYLMNNDQVIIHYDTRVIGSRTAVANDGTRSIASLAQMNNMKLVCIVMGAESVYAEDGYTVQVFGGYDETKQLLDLGFTEHKTAQLFFENQVIVQKSVVNGSSELTLGTGNAAYSVIPSSVAVEGLVYRYVNEETLFAPVQKGQRVSTLQIWCGDVCLAQTDLFAMSSVVPTDKVFDNEIKPTEDSDHLKTVLIVVGGLVGVFLLCVIFVSVRRTSRIVKEKQRSRRNSRNRRRSR